MALPYGVGPDLQEEDEDDGYDDQECPYCGEDGDDCVCDDDDDDGWG